MSERPDYYRVLHVSRQATLLQIKQAYRRLARQFHPDLNPNNPKAAEQFKQICEAYEVLRDRLRREQYDKTRPPEPTTPKTFEAFYLQGIDKLALRDYAGAIADFTQALDLRPTSLEAYLGRCQAQDNLKQDRALLDDCYQILQLDPCTAQAHYYRGRARTRLGYPQSAVEAYTQAIALEPEYAQAYYQRGRIRLDLQDIELARQDLQTAVELFQVRQDFSHAQQAEQLLGTLSPLTPKSSKPSRIFTGQTFLKLALSSIPSIVLNPSGNLLPIFARLTPKRAAGAGLLYGLIGFGSVWMAGWRLALPPDTLGKWMLATAITYGSLAMTLAIARIIGQGKGHWASDCFLAGVALLPIAGFVVLSSFVHSWGLWAEAILAIFAGCYSTLILYMGYTQLSNLAEHQAMVAVPLTLLSTLGTTAFVIVH